MFEFAEESDYIKNESANYRRLGSVLILEFIE